jgi:outer membrane receptor protein involved in Fe transport
VRWFVCDVLIALCLWGPSPVFAQAADKTGVVVEESGGAIGGAQLLLRSAHGTILRQAATAPDGTFTFEQLMPGSYWLDVTAPHFQGRRMSLDVASAETPPLSIVLSLAPFHSEVTVTAHRGTASDIEHASPIVTVREEESLRGWPLATIGNALEGGTGVMVQQSTYGQASPFLRGLTGYHVLNLIDGVRFNNSTFRSGPNQYLAFVEPSQAHRIEAMLGPASSQFGSDALGGAISW